MTGEQFIDFENDLIERLSDLDYQREFLNVTLEDYAQDSDFKAFFKALELVIKARGNISNFAKNSNINRRNLYALFEGKQKPQLETVVKILHELGFSLRIA